MLPHRTGCYTRPHERSRGSTAAVGMNLRSFRPSARQAVWGGAVLLFAVWLLANLRALTSEQSGWIRFALTLGFAVLIVARPKPGRAGAPIYGDAHEPVLTAVIGTALALAGLILHIRQAEWIGTLLMLWGCLRWALPTDYRRDLTMAILLLYWAHPLPGQIFGPLELAAQRASVRGAEILLLGLDVRVWADGMVLHSGFSIYEIPGWCSGMRTATTVFLLAWGLAILHRFRLVEAIVLVIVAVLQAMVLNIVRIATMVVLVPRVFSAPQAEYLHTTAGVIVVAAVFLVYLEARAWRRFRHRDEPITPAFDLQIERPADWRHLRSVRWAIIGGGALTTLITVGLYRNSPTHRTAVLKDVAAAAHDANNLDLALQLAREVVNRDPNDLEWKLKSVRLLLTLERYLDVVIETDTLTRLEGTQAHERDVLKAYALMAMERLDEANALVRGLPEEIRDANPRVAMILAVVAFRSGDIDGVVRHIPLAVKWMPNRDRIRLMYPLLRRHRQWAAIADSDTPEPYRLPEPAFAAIEAHMNLDDTPVVAKLTSAAMAKWPTDPRALEPLYYLTLKRPDSVWEGRFALHLRHCGAVMEDVDLLYSLLDKCFELGRADLAWLIHHRIAAIDPEHPALAMAAVRHGSQWFHFRRRALGIPAPTATTTLDLRPYFWAGHAFRAWGPLVASVPWGRELATANTLPIRQRLLRLALQQFADRRDRDALSLPMLYLYAHALEIDNQRDASRRELERIALQIPAEQRNVRVALSEMDERAGNWQGVYESLREYALGEDAALTPLLRLARAQLKLRLSIGGLHTATDARRRYPRSAQADAMLATALLQNNAPDEALHLIDTPRARHIRDLDVLRSQALFMTERFNEAESFCHAVLLSPPPTHADTPQRFVLPPAEISRLWHQFYRPSAAQFARNADVLRDNLRNSSSPYLLGLMRTWLDCYEGGASTNATPVQRWLDCGRDDTEKAMALNQLTLLLCSSGQYEDAAAVARQAAALLPQSGMLWRWAVSLSNGDSTIIAEARHYCPLDPELWLADVVLAAERAPERLAEVLAPALAADPPFPAESLTRAGEFLRRREHNAEARAILTAATEHATGLLPAFIQGLRCALAEQDSHWAIECTRQAILCALRPPPGLYRKLVDLKSTGSEPATDFDMVEALKNLRTVEPGNLFWAQMLGYVRFKRGGWEIMDALSQMSAAIEGGATNKLAFGVAAEAARLMDNFDRAAEILQEGLKIHPDDLTMLNNLAYVLSLTEDGIEEAHSLIPKLLERGAQDTRILDTVAAVQVAAGDAVAARATLAQLRTLSEPGSILWFRAQYQEARLLAADGALQTAIDFLTAALNQVQDPGDEDVVNANRLMSRWRYQLSQSITPPPPPAITNAPPAAP